MINTNNTGSLNGIMSFAIQSRCVPHKHVFLPVGWMKNAGKAEMFRRFCWYKYIYFVEDFLGHERIKFLFDGITFF